MTTKTKVLETFKGGHVIAMSNEHILTGNQNTWDMNYHLYEVEKRKEFHPIMAVNEAYRYSVEKEFLIDSAEIVDTTDDMEEYGGSMTWDEFSNMEDTDLMKEIAWQVYEH